MMGVYKVIGLMSGTSLDGLDIAYAEFVFENKKWKFNLKHYETVGYGKEIKGSLSAAQYLSSEALYELHKSYGVFLGQKTNEFILKHNISPDLIASHGHTVFHNPAAGITVQIGAGEEIARQTGVKVVYDFRTEDVANGGQGAPLVPIGDELLFGEYAACVNLGGFANVSMRKNGQRVAFDISPVNFVMNRIARRFGKDYDDGGEIARSGSVNYELLSKLNSLEYYGRDYPKSLGREWVEENIDVLINGMRISDNDLMRTFTEHISQQIALALKDIGGSSLFTGGGVYNVFLMERIRRKSNVNIIVPSPEIVDFKEALIFAFMGVLRAENQINIYGSVTGSGKDISAGKITEFRIATR